ncbi:MAG: LysM peptidoglycan-binding domain-containing protein [Anaerolineae bacterium]
MRRKWLLVIGLVLLLQMLWVPALQAAPPISGWDGGFWHRVAWGESLSTIGWRYGVNPYTICAVNGLANCNFVYAGQLLWIPSGGRVGPSYRPCAAYYVVRWGDTLNGIARWYGMDAWSIARANHIYNLNRIYAGQTLCIPLW